MDRHCARDAVDRCFGADGRPASPVGFLSGTGALSAVIGGRRYHFDGLHRGASRAGGQPEQGDQHAEPTETPEETDTGTTAGAQGAHGALVNAAAQAVTPAGFANHGAYVRTIAQNNAGQAAKADRHTAKTKTH